MYLSSMGYRPFKFAHRKKMGNTFTSCQMGHFHRSKLEASVCSILHLRQRAGEIKEILVEDRIYLSDARICYVVDFKCIKPDKSVFFCEAKGHPNDTWAIKKKLWKAYGPAPLEIYKGTHLRPVLDEIIHPLNNK